MIDDNSNFCVIVGDPIGGIRIYGPFYDSDSAMEWAEHNAEASNWWVTELHHEMSMESYQ
jgi:hypothetical protein